MPMSQGEEHQRDAEGREAGHDGRSLGQTRSAMAPMTTPPPTSPTPIDISKKP